MATANVAQMRAGAQSSDPFQELLARPMSARFDPDAYHAMQERDSALIRDELMHGYASKAFVYNFDIKGTKVHGISVVGARELASQYKGIKSRIVATIEKRGALFIFRTFTPLSIETRQLPELEGDSDFYECVMEVSDIKTGNSVEVRKKESRTERKRDGGTFERPHYDVIAESKAFRNGVLAVLPQSVIKDFEKRCLEQGNSSNEVTIQQRRAAAATYAAKNGITLDRQALAELSFAELDGLSGAAAGGLDPFRRAAAALGLTGAVDQATGEIDPPSAPAPAQRAAAPALRPAAAPAPVPTFDANAFAERLEAAKDLQTLQAMGAELAAIADDDARSTLEDVFMRRQAELEASAAPAAAAPTTSRRAARAPAQGSME
jgi:hypothetical protein